MYCHALDWRVLRGKIQPNSRDRNSRAPGHVAFVDGAATGGQPYLMSTELLSGRVAGVLASTAYKEDAAWPVSFTVA